MWGGKRVLSVLHALPRYLLTLPLWARLSSTLLTVILFVIFYISILPIENNPSILAIPVAQAAWMFKRRGVYFSVSSIVVAIWIFVCLKHHTFFPSLSIFLSFVVGITALLVVGFLISAQRASLDFATITHRKLEHINEQQKQLSLLKDQFILNVNHELRTPLATVYGYLELLLEHQEHMDRQKQRDFLKNALYSCEELQLLVNNVLDTMQIQYERPLLTIERLSIAEIIQEVVIHIDPRRQQEHILQLDIPEQLFVQANAQYVRQILYNLLSNAFKYTPIDTLVEIKAALYHPGCQEKEELPMVCISVRDRGPGIPPHELPRMFGQFFRLERDISKKIKGTGLGLYVSKQLVEAMGGRIWVESSGIIGEGSRFRFTLPCDGL
jgi:signal transduction histidine kinase